MLTVAGRFSVILEKLIQEEIQIRKDQLANFVSNIEEVRKIQGEIAGLLRCIELMDDADRTIRGVEGDR